MDKHAPCTTDCSVPVLAAVQLWAEQQRVIQELQNGKRGSKKGVKRGRTGDVGTPASPKRKQQVRRAPKSLTQPMPCQAASGMLPVGLPVGPMWLPMGLSLWESRINNRMDYHENVGLQGQGNVGMQGQGIVDMQSLQNQGLRGQEMQGQWNVGPHLLQGQVMQGNVGLQGQGNVDQQLSVSYSAGQSVVPSAMSMPAMPGAGSTMGMGAFSPLLTPSQLAALHQLQAWQFGAYQQGSRACRGQQGVGDLGAGGEACAGWNISFPPTPSAAPPSSFLQQQLGVGALGMAHLLEAYQQGAGELGTVGTGAGLNFGCLPASSSLSLTQLEGLGINTATAQSSVGPGHMSGEGPKTTRFQPSVGPQDQPLVVRPVPGWKNGSLPTLSAAPLVQNSFSATNPLPSTSLQGQPPVVGPVAVWHPPPILQSVLLQPVSHVVRSVPLGGAQPAAPLPLPLTLPAAPMPLPLPLPLPLPAVQQ